MLVVPAFGRFSQDDHEFNADLGYTMRPYLKKNNPGK
jgi:hypothetical protein